MRTVCLGGQHELQSLQGINDGGAFQSRTAGNGVEPPCFAILHRALAAAFGDVERNRERGPAKLVRQGAVAAGNPLGQRPGHAQERHCTTIHIEFLKAEHA